MSSIVIKAYWKKLNGERAEGIEEIRRISIDQEVSTNYCYLTEKIRQAFPSLRQREFTLFWKDSDGDLITFSNDDELVDALSHNVDKDLFRVFIEDVKPTSSQCPPAGGAQCPPYGGAQCPPRSGARCPSAGGTRCPPTSFHGPHPGVMCDGCDGPIIGIRFKCQVCPNYDLCTPCRSTGLHSEHHFMDIQNPPFQNMLAEVAKLYQQAAASGCTQGSCGEGGQPEWSRWWKMHAQQNQNQPEDKGNPTASAAEGAKETEEQWKKQQQEFLKNIGAFAAGILNPFGFVSESNANSKKEEAGSSSGHSAKKEMRSDQSQGGCQGRNAGGCQSANHTTAGGNASGETQPSASPTHLKDMGQSSTSVEGNSTGTQKNADKTNAATETTSSTNEQAVRACLQTLKEMGFTDEGGWLTSLVNVYQGIVAHVLDAIQANQNPQ